MSTEQILKFQPDRTLYLRGFTGVGAAASLYNASPTGFNVCGVFRDMADFCVLNLYDADNTFEHYTVRYLPDFNLSGLVLTFDVTYQGLQPLDSAKYSWIDWSKLDVIRADSSTTQIQLWNYAQLISGNYQVAAASCKFTTPGGSCKQYDRLTLFINNVSFDFVANGGETAAQVASFFVASINQYDWSTFASHSVSVIARTDNNGTLTLKNARAGHVTVAGTQVTYVDGIPFPGIAPGSTIYISAVPYTVQSVNSSRSLTLTSAAATATAPVAYLAEFGGLDGNGITAYFVVRPGNFQLTVDNPVLSLLGGNSDDVTWRVTLDFSALGIDQLRQAWMTFAPQLTPSGTYLDTEWQATFTNWTVADPKNIRALKCAAPGSLRIGNDDTRSCVYNGTGWSAVSANNYWHGFARRTANIGDSVTIQYSSTFPHDLYLGTSLFTNRSTVHLTLDGVTLPNLNCSLAVDSELVTRRLVHSVLPPGQHTLTITTSDSNPFVFDYLEAAVPGDFPDAAVTYANTSPALDYDTDATYKVSPQRLLWHIQKLGFQGQLNEYLGVFWWNQRKRASGYNNVYVQWNSAVITYSGSFNPGESLTVTIGSGTKPFTIQKFVTTWDTPDTIAQHFAYYINSASVSMWAEKTGTGQLTIHTRTPNWGDVINVGSSSDTRINLSGNIAQGVDGTWIIDPSASNPINYPVRQWHSNLFALVKAAGLQITTSFSMEFVNPPDDNTPGNEWIARFYDGTPVVTATGFSNLSSSQCAPITNVTNYQKSVFQVMAGLQQSAGLTPWLQFGEFLWWYFSSPGPSSSGPTQSPSQAVGYCRFSNPISIGLAQPHGMNTGDRVVITGVLGCTAANGTWNVTVTDPTHFTIPVPANAAWVPGTGQVRGGSMAYYDTVTKTAAQTTLGRPLYQFTCQDDDPTVNNGADTAFLAARLKAHVDAIRTQVLSTCPQTRFELLYPNDVNNPVCYLGPSIQYPQGGRLNAVVNLPAQWQTQATSGFDRFKVEALSWSATYSNLTLADQAVSFACTPPMNWNPSATAYLVPWFNGICPWPAEYHTAQSLVPLVNFWAYDHLALMSWPLPLPSPLRQSGFFG